MNVGALCSDFLDDTKGTDAEGHVEQTWFAGVHCNVGGGYPDTGLSDEALIWMIARVQALTGLEFDADSVKAATRNSNVDGEVYDSSKDGSLTKPSLIVAQFSRQIRFTTVIFSILKIGTKTASMKGVI
jgi:Uncharacterized alpha/beta hydrolase domain (DUF2235)